MCEIIQVKQNWHYGSLELTESRPVHSVKPFDAFNTKTPPTVPSAPSRFHISPTRQRRRRTRRYHCTLQARAYGPASLTLISCGKGSVWQMFPDTAILQEQSPMHAHLTLCCHNDSDGGRWCVCVVVVVMDGEINQMRSRVLLQCN